MGEQVGPALTLARRPQRKALTKELQVEVFRRDRWLCRWCGRPVIFAPAMKYLERYARSRGHTGPLAKFETVPIGELKHRLPAKLLPLVGGYRAKLRKVDADRGGRLMLEKGDAPKASPAGSESRREFARPADPVPHG